MLALLKKDLACFAIVLIVIHIISCCVVCLVGIWNRLLQLVALQAGRECNANIEPFYQIQMIFLERENRNKKQQHTYRLALSEGRLVVVARFGATPNVPATTATKSKNI